MIGSGRGLLREMRKMLNCEIIRYIFFGILSTIINIVVFFVLINLTVAYTVATVSASIVSILFAFFTNKKYVFLSESTNRRQNIIEMVKFMLSRVITLLIDFLGMILFIEVVSFSETTSKVLMNIIVIMLNYLFSKFLVFIDIRKVYGGNQNEGCN